MNLPNSKVVPVVFDSTRVFGQADCVALKRVGNQILMSFPFHEDTPVFHMSVSDLLNIRNAIEELVCVKQLNSPGEV